MVLPWLCVGYWFYLCEANILRGKSELCYVNAPFNRREGREPLRKVQQKINRLPLAFCLRGGKGETVR